MMLRMANERARCKRFGVVAGALSLLVLLPSLATAVVLFSDDFNRSSGGVCGTAADPLHPNLSLGLTNNAFGGTLTRGYIGTKGGGFCNVVGAALDNGTVLNSNTSFGGGGFEIALDATCCTNSTNVGQDLTLQADVLVPKQADAGTPGVYVCDIDATVVSAYFRSRNAYTGDGVRGGSTTGYRIEFDSLGQLRVLQNVNAAYLAVSARPSSFDASIFHKLVAAVQADPPTLRIALDERLVVLRRISDGALFTSLPLAATGLTQGGTGFEFMSDPNRQLAGQRVDNLIVSSAGPVVPCSGAGACDDGNRCTNGDTCVSGNCSGTPVDCSTADDQCNRGMCDPDSGACVAQPVTNGQSCDDSNPSTTLDQCVCGTCRGTCANDAACDDEHACTQDSCDPTTHRCVNATAPKSGCLTAPKTSLLIKQDDADKKDKVSFKWQKGGPLAQTSFGDPTAIATHGYSLCVYDSTPRLVLESEVPPATMCGDDPCWKADKTKGYKFKDRSGTYDGIKKMGLKGSDEAKSQVTVDGGGASLFDTTLPMTEPVHAQVIRADGGICFDSSYAGTDQVKKNDATQFKAKVAP